MDVRPYGGGLGIHIEVCILPPLPQFSKCYTIYALLLVYICTEGMYTLGSGSVVNYIYSHTETPNRLPITIDVYT